MKTEEFKFEQIQKNSIVIELTKRLLDFIFSGAVKPGDKLPTERSLQEKLGVSRSAVREAIKVLEVLGVLEVKQGDGTYLRNSDSGLLIQSIEWGMLLGYRRVADIIEARIEIEVSIAKLAAKRCSDEEIEELWGILQELKTATIKNFAELDIQFHLKLAEMAKNSALKGIFTSIQSLLRTWITSVIESAGETDFSYNDHLKIFRAVSERNPLAAAYAMEEHMLDAAARLNQVIEMRKRE